MAPPVGQKATILILLRRVLLDADWSALSANQNQAISDEFVKYSKRNTHADYNSPLPADAQPVLANGVSLDAPVSLYWSDEFTAGGTGKKTIFYFILYCLKYCYRL